MIERKISKSYLYLTAIILALRASLLPIPALIDTTEGRFAAVAQEMVLRGDWITPYIPLRQGFVPYWAKPPLHIWLTALSLKLFGMHEFSARLPAFVASLATSIMLYLFSKRFFPLLNPFLSVVVMFSAGLFFFISGGSLTDPTLCASITGMMVSFAFFADAKTHRESSKAGILFFVFAALGMLTKGPVSVALSGLSLFLWLLISRKFSLLAKLPWGIGLLAFFTISAPWYIAAEIKTPGFLHYFFINEHIKRYLFSNFGIKYGSGHSYAYGSIWIMAVLAFIPWSVHLLLSAYAFRIKLKEAIVEKNDWGLYLLCWALSAPIFFTFSKHILATYLLPSIPPLSLLTVLAFHYAEDKNRQNLYSKITQVLVALMYFGALIAIGFGIKFGEPFTVTALSVVLIWLSIALIRSQNFQNKETGFASRQIKTVAISTILLYSLVVLNFNHYVSNKRSAKSLLEYVASISRKKRIKIAVLQSHSYGAYFYDDSFLGKKISLFPINGEEIGKGGIRRYMIKRNDVHKVQARHMNRLEFVKNFGKWSLYRLKKEK
ncbi:MAG: glycosyltransferase family 39 protein [Candidatus Dadabacteria bacterium]|nr:MAG: glycosyltransferase family 39 protein [Candidatus Dadabacteria bacterium]